MFVNVGKEGECVTFIGEEGDEFVQDLHHLRLGLKGQVSLAQQVKDEAETMATSTYIEWSNICTHVNITSSYVHSFCIKI